MLPTTDSNAMTLAAVGFEVLVFFVIVRAKLHKWRRSEISSQGLSVIYLQSGCISSISKAQRSSAISSIIMRRFMRQSLKQDPFVMFWTQEDGEDEALLDIGPWSMD